MSYDKLKFQKVDIVNDGETAGKPRIHSGFAVEVDGEHCGVMNYDNTTVYDFHDQDFNYIEVAIDSLAKALGQEAEPGQRPKARIWAGASDDLEDLYDRLLEYRYPTDHRPYPSQEAEMVKFQAQIGQAAVNGLFDDSALIAD